MADKDKKFDPVALEYQKLPGTEKPTIRGASENNIEHVSWTVLASINVAQAMQSNKEELIKLGIVSLFLSLYLY